jgi:hypothetical protein
MIHQASYSIQISYTKSLFLEPTCRFNYLQLRVLINGGNKNAFDFFQKYDLD